MLHHDQREFLAGLDPTDRAFRARQMRLFDDLADVPLASWSYTFDPSQVQATRPPEVLAHRAPVFTPAVVYLHYRLVGFDVVATSQPQYLTFDERAGRWYLASDDDFRRLGLVSTPDMWDFGAVRVLRGRSCLVLANPSTAGLAAGVAAEADHDVPRVDSVWNGAWARRVVVDIPATQAELDALVGDGEDLSQIAALATAEMPPGSARAAAVGDRILINPVNFRRLGPLGRRIVLTHEITHVATRSVTGPDEPSWLVEGFADYVGFLDTGLTPRDSAVELRTEVDAGDVPSQLPDDADFAGADPRLAQAYEEAWLACRLVAERYGRGALLLLYRVDGASSGGNPSAELDRAMRSVLHTGVRAFTAQWREYLRVSLG